MSELETQTIERNAEMKLMMLTTLVSIATISLKLIMMTTMPAQAAEPSTIKLESISAKTDIQYLKQYAQSQNRSPKEAMEICQSKRENENCTFTSRREKKSVKGKCQLGRSNMKVCVPTNRPPPKSG